MRWLSRDSSVVRAQGLRLSIWRRLGYLRAPTVTSARPIFIA